jgi:hypothetical protein
MYISTPTTRVYWAWALNSKKRFWQPTEWLPARLLLICFSQMCEKSRLQWGYKPPWTCENKEVSGQMVCLMFRQEEWAHGAFAAQEHDHLPFSLTIWLSPTLLHYTDFVIVRDDKPEEHDLPWRLPSSGMWRRVSLVRDEGNPRAKNSVSSN